MTWKDICRCPAYDNPKKVINIIRDAGRADSRKTARVPPCVDDPGIYTAVRSGDFLADAKIAWRDAYEMQMRAAVRPLQQAAE